MGSDVGPTVHPPPVGGETVDPTVVGPEPIIPKGLFYFDSDTVVNYGSSAEFSNVGSVLLEQTWVVALHEIHPVSLKPLLATFPTSTLGIVLTMNRK